MKAKYILWLKKKILWENLTEMGVIIHYLYSCDFKKCKVSNEQLNDFTYTFSSYPYSPMKSVPMIPTNWIIFDEKIYCDKHKIEIKDRINKEE